MIYRICNGKGRVLIEQWKHHEDSRYYLGTILSGEFYIVVELCLCIPRSDSYCKREIPIVGGAVCAGSGDGGNRFSQIPFEDASLSTDCHLFAASLCHVGCKRNQQSGKQSAFTCKDGRCAAKGLCPFSLYGKGGVIYGNLGTQFLYNLNSSADVVARLKIFKDCLPLCKCRSQNSSLGNAF